MKFRKDFVTNSSSSSFVCEICGYSTGGWDMSLSEADMMECVNGHIFCSEHALERPNKKEMIKLIMENEYNSLTEEDLMNMEEDILFEDYLSEGGCYEIPECVCPICQFVEYSEEDLSAYLLKEYKVSRDLVFEEVKQLNKRRKKLYESEYITYVCKEFNLNPAEIVGGWKEKFGTYKAFKSYLRA